MVDPEGMGEKSVLIMPHATASCSQELCTPRPRPPPAPSLLGAVVGSVPQTCRGAVSLQTSGEGGLTDRQLGTLAFHDRLDAVGLGTPAERFVDRRVRPGRPSGFVRSPTTWLARCGNLGRPQPLLSTQGRRVRRRRGWPGSVQVEAALQGSGHDDHGGTRG